MCILKRILILTCLYEFVGLLQIIGHILGFIIRVTWIHINVVSIIWFILSTVVTISVWLMQQHNSEEYQLFLRLLYRLKIHYLCFGCKDVFIDAVQPLDIIDVKRQYKNGETEYDTRDNEIPKFPVVPAIHKQNTPSTIVLSEIVSGAII